MNKNIIFLISIQSWNFFGVGPFFRVGRVRGNKKYFIFGQILPGYRYISCGWMAHNGIPIKTRTKFYTYRHMQVLSRPTLRESALWNLGMGAIIWLRVGRLEHWLSDRNMSTPFWLPEMSPKISSKTYHFLLTFRSLRHQNYIRIFLYILYIFEKPPSNERKISLMLFWNLSHVWEWGNDPAL